MGRALKYTFRIGVLGVVALAAYAMLDDLPPPTRTIVIDLSPPGASNE